MYSLIGQIDAKKNTKHEYIEAWTVLSFGSQREMHKGLQKGDAAIAPSLPAIAPSLPAIAPSLQNLLQEMQKALGLGDAKGR
jgi:hypothetical protein